MNHFADPDFWFHYRQLPDDIRPLADKNFALLKADPSIRPSDSRRSAVSIPPELVFTTAHSQMSAPMDFNGSGLDIIRLTIGCSVPDRPEAPRLNFVVQHLLGLKEALIGCFVAMSFSWSVVEVFGD